MVQFLKKLKLYTKLVPETVHQAFLSKLFVAICSSPSSTKVFFYNWNITLNYWFVGKIDNFIWKYSWYMSDLLFSFLLSDRNIWRCFLYFMVTLIDKQSYFKWYLLAPPLNLDTASYMEIMKKLITQNNLDSFLLWVKLITHDIGIFLYRVSCTHSFLSRLSSNVLSAWTFSDR